jgi:hypothetical protein
VDGVRTPAGDAISDSVLPDCSAECLCELADDLEPVLLGPDPRSEAEMQLAVLEFDPKAVDGPSRLSDQMPEEVRPLRAENRELKGLAVDRCDGPDAP